MTELHSTNKTVENALNAARRRKSANAADGADGDADALNAPFFRKGQKVKAKSGRWAGEYGSVIDVVNRPSNFGQTRQWQPFYTVEFLRGTWQTDGSDLASA